MTGMNGLAQKIAADYSRAWTSGDVDTAMSYLAEDIVCDAPAGRIEGAPAYRRFTEDFVAKLTGCTITNVLGDDANAAVVYSLDTRLARGFQAVEYVTVEDGKITRILTVFDRLPLAEAARQAAHQAATTDR